MVCFHRLHRLMMKRPDEKEWKYSKFLTNIFTYLTVAAVHFTDQNWIPKTIYCIRCVTVCKIGFTNWNAKIALLRAAMVVTYYIKFFQTGTETRHNGILMSLLLLAAETNTFQPSGSVRPTFMLRDFCRV